MPHCFLFQRGNLVRKKERRRKEGKKERRKERRKEKRKEERKKEREKERKRERKKERKKERRKENPWLSEVHTSIYKVCVNLHTVPLTAKELRTEMSQYLSVQ